MLKRFTVLVLSLALLPLFWFACTAPSADLSSATVAGIRMPNPLEAEFKKTVHPFVQRYCVECHGGKEPEAELDLAAYSTFTSILKDPKRWDQVLERVHAGEMPPDDAKKQPTAAEKE